MTENYKVEQTARNVVVVTFPDVNKDWEQWVLLRSDAHHDNVDCNRAMERKHLDKAVERNALIVDAGDVFCAMQGKFDPRSSKEDCRPEDQVDAYLDSIVRHAEEDYAPYIKNWLVIGQGNHETNVLKRHGVDLISNLVHGLNVKGANCFKGFYGGYVRFMFKIHKTGSICKNLKYFHGKGGSAPVTKGVIDTARQAEHLPDAHIVLNGHNHNEYILSTARERMTKRSGVGRDLIQFVRTPGYKDEYGDGARGYGVELGGGPKPLGCAWMRFFLRDAHTKEIGVELTSDVA